MLTLVRRGRDAATVSSLRAACEALISAPDRVRSVSISGSLPTDHDPSHSILRSAERLARQHGFILDAHLEPGAFGIRFERPSGPTPDDAG
jgi:hypothetical protein